MNIKSIIVCVGVTPLLGCAALSVAPSSVTKLTAEPYSINLPKGLEGEQGMLKGLRLKSFRNVWGSGSPRNFFSVSFLPKPPAELTTEICRGDYYPTAGIDKSCVYYDSKVSVQETKSSYNLQITPYQMRTKQGRNVLFLPIDLPKVSIDKLYGWLSNQNVSFNVKLTSKYSPESIKANFDRKYGKSSWGSEDNGNTKQFKDKYEMNSGNKVATYIGASFYPYRNGSMVKCYIHQESSKTHDWTAVVADAKSSLKEVVNQ